MRKCLDCCEACVWLSIKNRDEIIPEESRRDGRILMSDSVIDAEVLVSMQLKHWDGNKHQPFLPKLHANKTTIHWETCTCACQMKWYDGEGERRETHPDEASVCCVKQKENHGFHGLSERFSLFFLNNFISHFFYFSDQSGITWCCNSQIKGGEIEL